MPCGKKKKHADVDIPRKEFAKEHRDIQKVLTKGTASQRKAEAKKQKKELKRELKKKG